MKQTFANAARIAALGLLITVATQIFYISSDNPPRDVIWSLETILFVVIAVAGLALLPARPVVGAGIALGGVLNTIQAGMGLVMFAPLMQGGEALGPVFSAVLAMAFLLYFAAKIAFGVAAIGVARSLWETSGLAKIVGVLAGIAGLAAVVLNTAAIFPATSLTYPAGGAGTAVALLLALALLTLPETKSQEP